MKVFLVRQDGGGAHEEEKLVSIHTTEAGAETEAAPLNKTGNLQKGDSFAYYVQPMEVKP